MSIPQENASDAEVEAHNNHLHSLHPLEPSYFPFASPIPAPSSPEAYVKLNVIRTGYFHTTPVFQLIQGANPGAIFTPPIPVYAFLIEKEVDGKQVRLVFDLGLRNSREHNNEGYKQVYDAWSTSFTPGTPSILELNHIPLSSLSAIILSHSHFDHIGDLSRFPSTTDLIVGPDSATGQALANDMDVELKVVEDRKVRALDRQKDDWKTVGNLKGIDYFGDGSLWILDTPGHKPGHITLLARTSTSPPAYHFLGGDTAHFIQLINEPSSESDPKPSGHVHVGLIPATVFDPCAHADAHLTFHTDLRVAYESMARVGKFDREDNVNVWLAHDTTMDGPIPAGDFVGLDGSLEELKRFKGRDRNVYDLPRVKGFTRTSS